MTNLQAAKALLNQWEETISGRQTDVPKPEIVLGKGVTKTKLETKDYARVIEGGDTTFEPRGFGWTHEKVEADITIELYTATRRINGNRTYGRHRMFGERDGLSEPDHHVGLTGETKRILDEYRKGFGEFDLVLSSSIRDTSDNEGANVFRADVDITFVEHANEIDPST